MRSYATTNEGTAYGNEIEFITTGQGPGSYKLYTEIDNITTSGATCFTEVNTETTILQFGVCWSLAPNPTVGNNTTEDGSGNDPFISSVAGLSSGTTYYLRAYAFTEDNEYIYGNEVEFTTVYEIGQTGPAGGYVFYDKGDTLEGWRYLEAAPSDLVGQYEWGCYGTAIDGADGQEVGDGQQNTIDILAGCMETDIAADICNKYVLNGYDDWFLPSLGELILMNDTLHMEGKGNFLNYTIQENSLYISSSESGGMIEEIGSWVFGFDKNSKDGIYTEIEKNINTEIRIRPVRVFK